MSEIRAAEERRALGYGLAAVAAWSTVATAFKLGLAVLAPLQLLLIATVLSAALFATLATVQGLWLPSRHTLAVGARLGLLNPFLYYLVLFEAYHRLPAQIAQPLNYTWAITLALLAVPVLGQSLSRHTLTGLVISYLGVVVLLWGSRGSPLPPLDWLGVALALGSTVLWAGYWLANARADLPGITLMAWSFVVATPLVAVACWAGPGWPELTGPALAWGAWVGLVEMGFTFLAWQQAMRRTRHAARISQLIFLSPFLSLVFIGVVLEEPIQTTSVLGLAVIVAGLWVSRRS